MIPWPVALLSFFYAVMATWSAAAVWRIASGTMDRPIVWPLAWLAVSVAAMCGLPLLKGWARQLALAGAWLLLALTLAVAAAWIRAGHPVVALAVTLSTAVHVTVIRYLGRPAVKAIFISNDATSQ